VKIGDLVTVCPSKAGLYLIVGGGPDEGYNDGYWDLIPVGLTEYNHGTMSEEWMELISESR